ncbi:MAG: hypothetical protein RLZZ524_983, partial [Pseudomonadota bacterium]
TMFVAGLVPAVVMVGFLLLFGGYLRRTPSQAQPLLPEQVPAPIPAGNACAPTTANDATDRAPQLAGKAAPITARQAAWAAKWELLAPVIAIGSLVSGIATPTEGAALTAIYAIVTQAVAHRELDGRLLRQCLADCVQVIGGVMLILGMALGLTNYLIDAGIPDAAITWAQGMIPNRYVFLFLLNVFLFFAGALMEIFAAVVVLVPLLLPVAMSYGIDPVHFGVIFLANMEMGFLCPPAGMNLYFASAMFGKPMGYVARAVMPALLAIFAGTLVISWFPVLATGLPELLGVGAR